MPVHYKKADGLKRIYVEVTHEAWKQLKILALTKDQSISHFVTRVLEKYGKKHCPVKETETNAVEGV